MRQESTIIWDLRIWLTVMIMMNSQFTQRDSKFQVFCASQEEIHFTGVFERK